MSSPWPRVGRTAARAGRPRFLAFGLAVAGAAAAAAGAPVTLERVIEVGDPAPGFPAGAAVALVGDAPRIDASGAVSLLLNVRDPEGRSFQALYRATDGEPALVFRSGDPAPGVAGRFALFPALPATPRIDGRRLTFAASTDLPAAGAAGIWSDRSGRFGPLVLVGDRLPGMPSAAALVDFSFGTRGADTLLLGSFGGGGPLLRRDRGLWRHRSGRWEPLVVGGGPAPGLGGGVVFDTEPTQAFGPVFAFDAAADGPAVIQAWVSGPGIDESNDEALWLAVPGRLSVLAREGDRLPGRRRRTFGPTAGAPTFGGLGENPSVVMSPSGAVVFGAVVTSARGRLNSVWSTRRGEPRLEVRGAPPLAGFAGGDRAPGLVRGATFASFEAAALNAAGVLALQATASGGGKARAPTRGLWWDAGGALALIAAAGRPAPGLPGVTVDDVALERLTAGGALLFSARLSGLGVTGDNDRALFAATAGGSGPALREGDPARVVTPSGDRMRTVAAFRLGDGLGGDGRVAIEVVFADGSAGVYRLALR